MMKCIYPLGAALLLLAPLAQANPATDALRLQDKHKLSDQFYRLDDSGDQQRIARHDPTKPEGQQWLLETVDGRPATAAEQTSFATEQAPAKGHKGGLTDMIDESTLTPIDGNARRWRFGIKPGVMPSVEPDKLAGELTLTDDGQLASVDLHNPEPFRVLIVAKFEKIAVHIDYAWQPGGFMLPARQTKDVVISGAVSKRLHQIQRFSEYRAKADS